MKKAIKITLKKAESHDDVTASKLFGAPVLPVEWKDRFYDDTIFFGQIRLADIAELDAEHRLPHTGYLYLFLDTESYPYTPIVEHYDGEPNLVIEDFNDFVLEFSHLNQAFLMSFEECEADYYSSKLLGVPCPQSELEDEREVLLQFDPLDVATGFLEEVDGYAYFFFGEDGADFEHVTFEIIRS